VERRGIRDALRRSRDLGKGYYWRIAGITLVTLLPLVALQFVVEVLMARAEVAILGEAYQFLEILALGVIAIMLSPIASIFFALLYYDLRARKGEFGATRLTEAPGGNIALG
jgi:Na+-driven multidrug efflux pump